MHNMVCQTKPVKWLNTQRPRVLMPTEGRHLHTGALGCGPNTGRATCRRQVNLIKLVSIDVDIERRTAESFFLNQKQ